jgi:hypothetical protein
VYVTPYVPGKGSPAITAGGILSYSPSELQLLTPSISVFHSPPYQLAKVLVLDKNPIKRELVSKNPVRKRVFIVKN